MTRNRKLFAAILFLFIWCSIFLHYETFASFRLPQVTSVSSVWLPFTNENVSSFPNDLDINCIFRNSSLYRKIYVYPSPGEPEWQGSILSNASYNNPDFPHYPWDAINTLIRNEAREQYFPYSMTAQFSTELIVHNLIRNTCLRTYDPEQADLFLVPYLPSVEFHAGIRGKPPSHGTSPYAQAILDILDSLSFRRVDTVSNAYEKWENLFGLTSHYWKRRDGADHLLIFSEPLQGLTHPKGKRGSFHFIHTQRQLDPPIVLSVELSTSFVQKYPSCARKNILLPYPVTDGNQFNGESDRIAMEVFHNLTQRNNNSNNSLTSWKTAALPQEQTVANGRPFAYWLKAGIHGACVRLRQSMNRDYKHCSPSFGPLRHELQQPYSIAMRLATFCPCPGGDTASAKRMFDAILAGCIPVILSHDFVWPFSTEIVSSIKSDGWLDPSEFSLRWNASEYEHEHYNFSSCQGYGLEERLKEISAVQIASLRRGMQRAARLFRYWEPSNDLPFNLLHHDIQPNGGAVKALVKQLEERAAGRLWPACREELEQLRQENVLGDDPTEFVC